MTQSGKSTAELARMISREGAQVILDPHNNLAVKYMQWVACNSAAGNVVYEDIARTDRVLRWMFLEPSGNKGLEGMRENENRSRIFADILCRRRGLDIHKTPLIEEWAIAAITLWMHQQPMKPLTDIVYAFHVNRITRKKTSNQAAEEMQQAKRNLLQLIVKFIDELPPPNIS